MNLFPILIAEDDPDDRYLIKDAFKRNRIANPIYFVKDGVELLEFLNHEGAYSDPESSPRPGMVLLDLNMPRMDGRQALGKIKENPNLRCIPVVVLTTSDEERDLNSSYNLGANSYITKPVDFKGLVTVLNTLNQYWFGVVELPKNCDE